MSSHKGLRENLAISVSPLLFYTSVTWVWSLSLICCCPRDPSIEKFAFLPVLSSLVGHIGLATWDQKKMEHRTIFIGTVFIIRAFMDLLRTNICSLLTCKSHLLNIVFYVSFARWKFLYIWNYTFVENLVGF